jgi:uncharacterized BrkB/YihY/UPF0761 family membrane protein
MAFREKIAWLTLGTMLIAYAAYFGVVGPAVDFGERRMLDIVWSFGLVAVAHAVMMIIGVILIAVTATREAAARSDERDRAIERRGTRVGYYLLTAGIILVGIVMPFTEAPWKIVNTALLVLVLSEAVTQVVVLVGYRRGL